MAPTFATIDMTDDFSPAPVKAFSSSKRTLLLAPPSIAAQEDKLRDVFANFSRNETDMQMLDRLSAGQVSLPAATYDLVMVLTDNDGAKQDEALQLLSRKLYGLLVPAMKVGGKLKTQYGRLGQAEAREAVLAGLVERDGVYEKAEEEEVVVPLRFGAKKKNAVKAVPVKILNLDDDFDDDDLIDEDTLLTEADLARPIQQREFHHYIPKPSIFDVKTHTL